MALFHNNSFRKPKRSHFDEKKKKKKKRYICVVIFSIQFSQELSYQSVLSAFPPSVFSLIAVKLNLKNECQIYLSHQQLPSRATLSLLRFSSTAIELKLDGKCALI